MTPREPLCRCAPLQVLRRLVLTAWIACVAPDMASADAAHPADAWVSTWIASPQPPLPHAVDHYEAQSLRLIAHVSAGGTQARIRLSNLDGDTPLTIGAAHVARRTHDADIDPDSDRALTFHGHASVVIPAHATVWSDAVRVAITPLSDLSVSLYLPKATSATTVHILAQQTSYVSQPGNAVADAHFPVARRLDMWPFLSGIDVEATPPLFAVAAFGDSTVDGDGSTPDANQRWPDALAARLQQASKHVAVLNAGLIGNRLLRDSPRGTPYGQALGEAGLTRFSRDALDQPGVTVVIVRMGSNDIGFVHALDPSGETVDANALIAGYRRLIALAHQHGVGIIGTTIPPFENASLPGYSTPAKEAIRQQVNAWIRQDQAFDALLDADQILRDPSHPARLLASLDSGDHLHPNDAGYRALAQALPLETLERLANRPARAPSPATANTRKGQAQ